MTPTEWGDVEAHLESGWSKWNFEVHGNWWSCPLFLCVRFEQLDFGWQLSLFHTSHTFNPLLGEDEGDRLVEPMAMIRFQFSLTSKQSHFRMPCILPFLLNRSTVRRMYWVALEFSPRSSGRVAMAWSLISKRPELVNENPVIWFQKQVCCIRQTLTSILVRPTSRTSGITRNGNDISLVVR